MGTTATTAARTAPTHTSTTATANTNTTFTTVTVITTKTVMQTALLIRYSFVTSRRICLCTNLNSLARQCWHVSVVQSFSAFG